MTRLASSLAGCGVRWIREDFNWQQICALCSRVSVRRHDQAIDAAISAGLNILGVPTTWPDWTHPYTTQGVREFTSFLGTFARRYRGRVAAWEIWNEPNLPASWRGTVEQYVELLSATYTVLKEIDPTVTVVAPCTVGPGDLSNPASFVDLAWIERFLQFRRPVFDVFSFHPYEGRKSPEQSGLADTVRRLQGLLRTAGRPPRIWITEQGWASDGINPVIDDVQQARLLVRAYLLGQAAGIERFFWYDARNDGPALDDRESNFGLLRRDFSAKAAYRALTVLASLVGNRRFARTLSAPDGISALQFDGVAGQAPVVTVWSPRRAARLGVAIGNAGGTLSDLDETQCTMPPGRHVIDVPAGLVRFISGTAVLSASL